MEIMSGHTNYTHRYCSRISHSVRRLSLYKFKIMAWDMGMQLNSMEKETWKGMNRVISLCDAINLDNNELMGLGMILDEELATVVMVGS